MLSNVVIDQAKTFAGLVYVSCQPKIKFGSKVGEQEKTKDGERFMWEIEVLGAVFSPFGDGTNSEVVKIRMASKTNPCEGIPAFRPVEISNFSMGAFEKKTKDKETGVERITGVNIMFRADEIKLAVEDAPSATSKLAA